jgi:hypothetical protein
MKVLTSPFHGEVARSAGEVRLIASSITTSPLPSPFYASSSNKEDKGGVRSPTQIRFAFTTPQENGREVLSSALSKNEHDVQNAIQLFTSSHSLFRVLSENAQA